MYLVKMTMSFAVWYHVSIVKNQPDCAIKLMKSSGQDPTPPARGQQQQLSMHLEHEFLHSHDGHAQEVHPHDLHVVASGHAHLSGPQASQSFGQHVIVAGRSEVRRGMAKRRVPSVGRTDFRGRSDGGPVGAPRAVRISP